eukprot:7385336-Prymnesium_polylepis.1
MIQSWNKFCFSEGAVELRARMPGLTCTTKRASGPPSGLVRSPQHSNHSALVPRPPGPEPRSFALAADCDR